MWFRGHDLRLADHAALRRALAAQQLVLLYVVEPALLGRGAAHHTQFLLEAIEALASDVAARGSRLLLAAGDSLDLLPRLVRRWRITSVVAQARTLPDERELERRLERELGVPLELFEGETLAAPGSVRTGVGTPYRVFTPFARAFAELRVAEPLPAPRALPAPPPDVDTDAVGRAPLPTLRELGLCHSPGVLPGGERAARERLRAFLAGPGQRYAELRDRLDVEGTSRLSCDLKFGTLSPRAAWARARSLPPAVRSAFRNELLWREFARGLLWDSPELLREPFRAKFENFPWRDDAASWSAWVAGRTGYPVVDASARQLLAEGFVPNRARMISASFLTKQLLIDYRRGEAHYLAWLTDGDPANNNAGWQWSAGCGADAQPFFRIFNPISQGKKLDPEGRYVRRWLPELGRLPARHVHAPWLAPPDVLARAGLRLGVDYPLPIVDHASARARFLEVAQRCFAGISVQRDAGREDQQMDPVRGV